MTMWPFTKRPGRSDDDFRREIESHIALEIERLVGDGCDPAAARAAARRKFGNVTASAERFYESGRVMGFDDFRADVAYAARSLRRHHGFAAVAIFTLALGIGATTAIFSLVNALLLTPLPYAGSDRLVRLIVHVPAAESPTKVDMRVPAGIVTVATVREIRSRMRTLSHLGIYGPSLVTMTGASETARLQGTGVSPAVFDMLGAHPVLGRSFASHDEERGAEPVVMLSHATWQRYFGGAPDIVGRTVTLTASLGRGATPRQHLVIGVMPRDFAFPDRETQFWIALAAPTEGTGARGAVLGRLADHASPEAAAAEVGPIVRDRQQHTSGVRYQFVREQDEIVDPVRPALKILMVAVGFVLLIACVNVANLVLARTGTRQREIAIRLALGARRGRVVRLLLAESTLLALLGGIGGIALAFGGVRLLRELATTLARIDLGMDLIFPRLDEIGIDWRVLLFTVAASVVTGLLCGMVPAVRHTRVEHLGTRSPDDAGGPGGRYTRSVLVVAETAMAIVLLVGGGLLIHSFIKLSRVDPGYDSANVLTFQVALPAESYPIAKVHAFAEDLVERLRSVPEVALAAYARQLPMVALTDTTTFQRHSDAAILKGDVRVVSRDYQAAMRIPLVGGRTFERGDREGALGAMLINETMARTAFAGQEPIGARLGGAGGTSWEIVGVVRDVRQFRLDREPDAQIFVDARQALPLGLGFPVGLYVLVRTHGHPTAAISIVRRLVREVDAQAGVFNVAAMDDIVSNQISRRRMYAVLLGIFAGVAVALAAIGLYSVMAYSVAQRTREIGVRMALGAQRVEVLRLVVHQGMVLTLIGVVLGVVAAAAVTRYLEGMLFGLTPLDPSTFVGVALFFVVVATLASYVPARRATQVDPLVALRYE
jgi:putative ABC transport system permease protein